MACPSEAFKMKFSKEEWRDLYEDLTFGLADADFRQAKGLKHRESKTDQQLMEQDIEKAIGHLQRCLSRIKKS